MTAIVVPAKTVRTWAKDKGLKVSDRARLPRSVYEAYEKAHNVTLDRPVEVRKVDPVARMNRPKTIKVDLNTIEPLELEKVLRGKKIVWKGVLVPGAFYEARAIDPREDKTNKPLPLRTLRRTQDREGRTVLHFPAEDGLRSVRVEDIVQIRR